MSEIRPVFQIAEDRQAVVRARSRLRFGAKRAQRQERSEHGARAHRQNSAAAEATRHRGSPTFAAFSLSHHQISGKPVVYPVMFFGCPNRSQRAVRSTSR